MSTIEKALDLLSFLSVSAPEIGLSDYKKLTGLDKGTLHRHLTALKNSGFLEQNSTTRAYRLGPAVIRLAALREKTVPLIKAATPFVDDIARETRELVHAALPQKSGMSTLYHRDGGLAGTRVGLDDSEVLPFHATSSGLAYLAFAAGRALENARLGTWKDYTDKTPTSEKQLNELLSKTQIDGYAFANQFYEAEVCSVAVPFFGFGNEPIGTIAIATPVSRMSDQKRKTSAQLLFNASAGLTLALGGSVPASLAEIWGQL